MLFSSLFTTCFPIAALLSAHVLTDCDQKSHQVWRELHHGGGLEVGAVVRQPELEELSAVQPHRDGQHGQHVGEGRRPWSGIKTGHIQ